MATRRSLWQAAVTDMSAELVEFDGELWLQAEHEDTGQGAFLLTDEQAYELEMALSRRRMYSFIASGDYDEEKDTDALSW